MVRSHRQGEEYPTPERPLANLPVALRALCDVLLAGEATALAGALDPPGSPATRH